MTTVTVPLAAYVPLVVLAVFGFMWILGEVRGLRQDVLAARRRAQDAARRDEKHERVMSEADTATAELVEATDAALRELDGPAARAYSERGLDAARQQQREVDEVTEAARRELGRAIGQVTP